MVLGRDGEAEAHKEAAVKAAKVHVKQDEHQEEEVIRRYEIPCRTLAQRRVLSGNMLFSS